MREGPDKSDSENQRKEFKAPVHPVWEPKLLRPHPRAKPEKGA